MPALDLDDVGRGDRRLAIARSVAALALACAIGWIGWSALNREQPRASPVQPISFLDSLPEPPPEPEAMEIEEIEKYEPTPEVEFIELGPAPPEPGANFDDSLGLDADGEGGGDSFGLKAKRGGRSVIELGKPGGGEDPAAAWRMFAGEMVHILERVLNRNDDVRRRNYELRIALWLSSDGHVARADVEQTTGDSALDETILAVLGRTAIRVGLPPEDMPQPIRLRVRARGGG